MEQYGEIFAQIYNRKWSGFAAGLGPGLVRLFAKKTGGALPRTALDLCCGTGQLSRYLLSAGFQVVGLDLSSPMLALARENNAAGVADGRAQFVQANAADFTLLHPVAFVVSTYDALNHLPDPAALSACFTNVYRALLPGGLFVFDLNTPTGLMGWNQVDIREDETFFLVNRGEYDGGARAYSRITGFMRRPDGAYDRFYEDIYNTAFSIPEVDRMLIGAGFAELYHAVYSDLQTPLTDYTGVGRLFFIAGKR